MVAEKDVETVESLVVLMVISSVVLMAASKGNMMVEMMAVV